MTTGKYELVIVWSDNSRSIYEYETEDKARRGEQGMLMANGNQIEWSGIRPQYVK